MKWMYGIPHKKRVAVWATLIMTIFFAINWVDKRNANALDSTFDSVYEDRLLVESYIFLLSENLYQKKITMSTCSNYIDQSVLAEKISNHNKSINELVVAFGKTKLTREESSYFAQLKNGLKEIETLEGEFITSKSEESRLPIMSQIEDQFETTIGDLNQLSKIQITEGKVLKDQSKKILAGSTLLTQFELVIIIGIGILIQVLIFASRTSIPKKPQNYQLN
ncbi:MAG: MCP four helix bundle domain-containing protein [Cyclobacteriaceae bacterium]